MVDGYRVDGNMTIDEKWVNKNISVGDSRRHVY